MSSGGYPSPARDARRTRRWARKWIARAHVPRYADAAYAGRPDAESVTGWRVWNRRGEGFTVDADETYEVAVTCPLTRPARGDVVVCWELRGAVHVRVFRGASAMRPATRARLERELRAAIGRELLIPDSPLARARAELDEVARAR